MPLLKEKIDGKVAQSKILLYFCAVLKMAR